LHLLPHVGVAGADAVEIGRTLAGRDDFEGLIEDSFGADRCVVHGSRPRPAGRSVSSATFTGKVCHKESRIVCPQDGWGIRPTETSAGTARPWRRPSGGSRSAARRRVPPPPVRA